MLTKEILRIKGGTLYTVGPAAQLAEAVDTMVAYDIGSLVVMDHGRLTGMLTFREVLRALTGAGGALGGRRVEEVMVREPTVVGADVEVDELRRIMLDTRVRYVPIMDGTTLVGVLSFHDVARAVLEEQGFENRMLKGYIKNWPE
jgi:CBS domain-containing protein